MSEASSGVASLDVAGLEERRLELKGIPAPVGVRVLRSAPRFL